MKFHDTIEDDPIPALPILVAKHDKNIQAILICQSWKGVKTHWYGGHTIACSEDENCPACDVGQQWVKKYYIAATSARHQNVVILMITPTAAAQVFHHRREGVGLLGMEIVLGRAAKRNTSPMTARSINYHPGTPDFGTKRLERVVLRIFAANANLKTA